MVVVDAVLKPVGAAFDFDDVGVVEEAVEDGGGGGDVADEFAPFLQGAVGGHEGGAQVVAAHDDFEEVFPGLWRELFDAHVVDDQEIALEVAAHGSLVSAFVAVVAKVFEEVEDGAVEDGFAAFDQLVADGLSKVTFADSGWSDEEDVFGVFTEASGGKLVDLGAVDRGIEAEVEAVEGAFLAEGGGFVPAGDHALMSDVEFVLEEEFEELFVGEVVASGFLQAQVERRGEAAEAQFLEGLLKAWMVHIG
jgi:hypothetical protein